MLCILVQVFSNNVCVRQKASISQLTGTHGQNYIVGAELQKGMQWCQHMVMIQLSEDFPSRLP